jgi:ligand-binding sensor domain-containing protein
VSAIRLGLLVTLLVALPSGVGATRWFSYTEADGLPGEVAMDLVQAPDGAIWAATSGGVARIDRRQAPARWETISLDLFNVLAVDSRGVVWAGGPNGRLQWFAVDGTPLDTPVALPAEEIVDLDAGPNGEMWIGQSSWLRRWDPSLPGGVPDEWSMPGLGEDAVVLDIERTPFGRVWVGLGRGFAYFNGTTASLILLPDVFGFEARVSAVHVLDNEDVVVGSAAGKAYVYSQSGRFSTEVFADGSREHAIQDIHRDALGRIWFARKEAHRFDTAGDPNNPGVWSRTILGAEAGLNGDILYAIVESSPFVGTAGAPVGSREMWFANDLGVSVQAGFPWTSFRTETGGLSGGQCVSSTANCNTVRQIALDSARDVVWFGALWGLSRLRADDEWSVWSNGLLGAPPGLVGPRVDALHVDDDGRLWVASNSAGGIAAGVQYHDADADDADWVTLGSNVDRWHVSDIVRDENGFLWLAARDGAWRLDTSTTPFGETHFDAAAGVPAGALEAAAAGSGFLFVASAEGIGRFDLASEQWARWPLSGLAAPLPTRFSALHVQGGQVYAGTDAGMLVVSVDALSLAEATRLSAQSAIVGFPDDVRDIADGGNGSVLVATLSGLYRVNSALDRAGRISVRDGLPEEEILSLATDGDEVWIGTNGDGAAAHRFEAPETAILEPPPAVVTSTAVPVIVVVTGADADSPEELLQFELRVDDGAWQAPLPGPSLSFLPAALGLADGLHVLQVRAVDNGLIADGTPAMAAFEIDTSPPNPRVTSPTEGEAVRGVVTITGTTEDLEDGRFASSSVRAQHRDDPSAPPVIVQPSTAIAVVDATITTWDTTTLLDDWYVLEVLVLDTTGVQGVQRIDVLVDNTAPFADVTSPVEVRGNEGATVYSAAGDAAIAVPPFAFDGERTLTIERQSDSGAAGGFAFATGPTDLQLRKVGTLQLALPAGVEDSGNLSIHREVDGSWVPLGGTRENRADGVFYSVAVDRLGRYSLRTASTPPSNTAVISQLQAEPRHFKPRTGSVDRVSVSFVLGQPASVTAMVYNRAGRPRRVLVEGASMGAGQQVVYWDGRDRDGQVVASALYIICVEAGGERVTKVVTVGQN